MMPFEMRLVGTVTASVKVFSSSALGSAPFTTGRSRPG